MWRSPTKGFNCSNAWPLGVYRRPDAGAERRHALALLAAGQADGRGMSKQPHKSSRQLSRPAAHLRVARDNERRAAVRRRSQPRSLNDGYGRKALWTPRAELHRRRDPRRRAEVRLRGVDEYTVAGERWSVIKRPKTRPKADWPHLRPSRPLSVEEAACWKSTLGWAFSKNYKPPRCGSTRANALAIGSRP